MPASRLGRHAGRFGWHYIRRTQLEDYTRAGAFARRVWHLGPAERVALGGVLLVAAVAGAAMLPRVPAAMAQPVVAACHLILFALAWAAAIASAATQATPLPLLAISPWLIFYAVLAGGALAGTPAGALPVAWMTGVLLRVIAADDVRWRRVAAWLCASALAGYVLPGVSGLRRAIHWTFNDTWALASAVLLLAGALAIWALRRRHPGPPRFAPLAIGSFIAIAVTVAGAASLDPALTIDWVRTAFDDASAIVVLFFLWTSGSFAGSVINLARWGVRRTARLAPHVLLRPVALLAMLAASAWQAHVAAAGGLDRLLRLVLIAHAAFGVATAALLAWWWIRGAASRARVVMITTWWIVAWAVLNGLFGFAAAVVASREAPQAVAGAGLLIVAAGLALELGKVERDWASRAVTRVRSQVGLIVAAATCAVVLMTTPGGEWETRRALMVLAGTLHLGVPLALAGGWRRHAPVGDLTVWTRVGFFAAGYACALVAMMVEPRQSAVLLTAVPVLIAILVALRRAAPHVRPSAGALAGAIFGGGVITAWMMPYPPTVPFLPRPAWIDLLRDWGALGRPPLTAAYFGLVVAAWAIGAAAGWVVLRRRA